MSDYIQGAQDYTEGLEAKIGMSEEYYSSYSLLYALDECLTNQAA